jgi:protein-L-isoaspartate O-methyltransferase
LIYQWPYILQICLKAKHSAIETGSGRGVHSIFISCFVPKILGIDNNVKLIEKARNRFDNSFP